MKKSLAILSVMFVMTGCASLSGVENAKNIAKLKYGQSKSQVLGILGTPDSVIAPSAAQTQWIYEFKKQDKRGQNMFVEFNSDGMLTKTGHMNGREVAAANEHRTPGICTKRVHPEFQLESLCLK